MDTDQFDEIEPFKAGRLSLKAISYYRSAAVNLMPSPP